MKNSCVIFMDKTKLGVIIPVYNTPIDLLKKCINSVINSKFVDFKLIIINSGTSKKNDDYLNDLQHKFPNLCCVYKINNKGASYSRNYAIKRIDTEYVTFVDSDDLISDNFFESAIDLFNEDKDVELVIGKVGHLLNNNKTSTSKNKVIETRSQKTLLLDYLVSGKNIHQVSEFSDFLVGRVYPKIIKRELLQKNLFSESLVIHEDNLQSFKLISMAKKIILVPEIWYQYEFNEKSVTHDINFSFEQRRQLLYNEIFFTKNMIHEVRESEYNISNEALGVRIVNGIINYLSIIDATSPKCFSDVTRLLKSGLLEKIPNSAFYKEMSDLSFKQKIILKASNKTRFILIWFYVFLKFLKNLFK